MATKCKTIVFSNKAYNAIIRESFDKDPVETGGILLGHILDNGVWIVMEVLPPGIKCIFERVYFEYDDAFVNYLAQSIANQYKIPLDLLGLWHRHPGSMDVFSSTDDGTNMTFAQQNPNGVISGLVNIDPQFRLTMYHMDNPMYMDRLYERPNYERIDIEIGDDIIPDEYFLLRYFNGEESNLNPFVDHSHRRMSRRVQTEGTTLYHRNDESLDIRDTIVRNHNQAIDNPKPYDEVPSWIKDYKKIWELLKKNKIVNVTALILVIASIFSIKMIIGYGKSATEYVISWFQGHDKENPKISITELTLRVGNSQKLELENLKGNEEINWRSSNSNIATVNQKGEVTANNVGSTTIILSVNGKEIDNCQIKVIETYNLSATELSLKVNQKYLLKLKGIEDGSEVKWYSSDEAVATVTKSGKVEAKKAGKVEIKAKKDEVEYVCYLTVEDTTPKQEPVTRKIVLIESWKDTGYASLPLNNKNYQAKAILQDPSANKDLISFRSEDTSIATVDESTGSITPISVGNTNIVVLYNGEDQDTLKLTIKEP